MIRGSIAALLSAVYVCGVSGQESPYRAPWEIQPRAGYTLEKDVFTERAIPALVLWKDEFADMAKPVVFLLHGGGMPDVAFGSDRVAKELWFLPEYYGVPYLLADGGLAVVIMDQWWAGERFKAEYRDLVGDNYLGSVIRGYVNTTQDVSLMLDALSIRDDLDTQRVGLCGRSGGGIVSLMAAATDKRVTAITSWVGQADLMSVAKTKMPEPMVREFMERDAELEGLLKSHDPIHRLEAMPPTAVLLINNLTDPSIPFDVVRNFHEQLAPHYAAMPNRLEFRVMEPSNPTHETTREDYAAGCDWLIEHLRVGEAAETSAERN